MSQGDGAGRGVLPIDTAPVVTGGFVPLGQGDVPIALLPVRLETRFVSDGAGGSNLRVRIYPDAIHIDTLKHELSSDEQAWAAQYKILTANATDGGLAAWAQLADHFGVARAAWIARWTDQGFRQTPPPLGAWAHTNVLPDRWFVTGYRNGQRVFSQGGTSIPDPLTIGPDPSDPSSNADPHQPHVGALGNWQVDFQAAQLNGMGIEIALGPGQPQGLDLLLAYGVKTSLAPKDGPKRIGKLFDAHHFTDGLGLMPQGAPTNNTPDMPSAYGVDDPGHIASFKRERGPVQVQSADGSDGARLAAALGLDASTFAAAEHASGSENSDAQALNGVLWPVTWGYLFGSLLAPQFGAATLEAIRHHFVDWVRGRGPFSALRIGDQIYGLLPVAPSTGTFEGDPLLYTMSGLLDRVGPYWVAAGQAAAPGTQTITALLERLPVSNTLWARGSFDVDTGWFNSPISFMGSSVAELKQRLSDFSIQIREARAILQEYTLPWSESYLPFPDPGYGYPSVPGWPVSGSGGKLPLVQAPPLTSMGPVSDDYLRILVNSTRDELLGETNLPKQESVLYLLARHGLRRALINMDISGSVTPMPKPPPPLPIRGSLGDRSKGDDAPLDELNDAAAGLAHLQNHSPVELQWLLGETLDLASSRYDAWRTSLATRRLASLRGRPGAFDTLLIGGYGWVMNLHPDTAVPPAPGSTTIDPLNKGYVHAPSLMQATTAAVLRSGNLIHRQPGPAGPKAPFGVDLSSQRVRLAQFLLDGIRAGQPLGALLGYRFERALHEAGQDAYIPAFRVLAPLDLPLSPRPDGHDSTVHATDVVDGVSLIRRHHSPAGIPWGQQVAEYRLGPQNDAVDGALRALSEALDAVSDALLAESVHQTIMGNYARAGALQAAASRGDLAPPKLDFVSTPRTGIAITHRVILLVPVVSAKAAAPGPRQRAEPSLWEWAASLLGDLSQPVAEADFVDVVSGTVRVDVGKVPMRLSEIGIVALDLLAVSRNEADLVAYMAGWLMEPQHRPAKVQPTDTVRILPIASTPGGAIGLSGILEMARAATELLAAARPLLATDVGLPDPVDLVDLSSRVTAARTSLELAGNEISRTVANDGSVLDPARLHAALMSAWFHGVSGAVPVIPMDSAPTALAALANQARAVGLEIARRVTTITKLETSLAGSPDQVVRTRMEQLAAIFGPHFWALPRTTIADSSAILRAVDGTATGSPDPAQDLFAWFGRMAAVRAPVAALEKLSSYCEAIGTNQPLRLTVGQLPTTSGAVPEPWVGLPLQVDTKLKGGRISLTFSGASPKEALQGALAGLMVDEWVEVVPNPRETTAITFHYNAPLSQAPQAILLAVPPAPLQPSWSVADLEATLIDTLNLVSSRVADASDVGQARPLLPGVYVAAIDPLASITLDPNRLFTEPAGYGQVQTLQPQISSVNPTSAKQGTTVDVTVLGQHLGGSYGVTGDGIALSVISSTDSSAVLRLVIGQNAPLNQQHRLRADTLGGSTEAVFGVSAMPQLTGLAPNQIGPAGTNGGVVQITLTGHALGNATVDDGGAGLSPTVDPSSTDTELIVQLTLPKAEPWVSDWNPGDHVGPSKPPKRPPPTRRTIDVSLTITGFDGTKLDTSQNGLPLTLVIVDWGNA